MSDSPAAIGIQQNPRVWWLVLLTGLLALPLGYLVSLDPKWLRMGFESTGSTHLIGLVVGMGLAIAILKWPEEGLLGLVAIVFTNASEVSVRFNHLPSLLQWLIPLLFIALVGRHLTSQGKRFVWDPLVAWLIVYGAVLFASSTRAANPQLADETLLEFLKNLLIFFLVINLITTRRMLRRAVWVLVLAGAFLGTISAYQALTSSYRFEFWGFGRIKVAQIVGYVREPRIIGPLSDPNFYAQALLVLVPVALYRLWDESSIRLKVIAAYALGVVLLALMFTYSRGGSLALGLVLLLAAIHKKVKLHYFCFGLLIVIPLYLLLIPKEFEGRVQTLKQLTPGGQKAIVHVDSSFQERVLEMGTARAMWVDYPVLGVGAGNYSEHFDEYAARIGSVGSSYELFDKRRLPHSLYLEVAAEIGSVGLIVLGAIILSTLVTFRRAYRSFKARQDRASSSIVISLALGFIGYLVTSLFLHGQYMEYFWLLAALAVAAKHVAQQPESCGANA